jgi:hypothetical protein
MNATLAIAGRELRDKTRLFLVAAVLAVLPFLAVLLPTSRGWDRGIIIGMFGGTLAIALGLGLAIALGAATIGRELTDRRLSFYFSKPVSPAAIWIGKAAASLFTALACFAIVGVPALLVSRSSWGATWTGSQEELVGVMVVAMLALFLVSHTLSTMIRSRSTLIAVDAVLLVLTVYGVVSLVRPLIAGGGMRLSGILLAVLGIALLLILAIGPVLQLAHGRTDARRSHVALSRVVWPALLVVFLAAAAYVAWVVHPSPSDLGLHAFAVQAPGGQWMMVAGQSDGRGDYQAAMMVNTRDGRVVRMRTPWSGPVFSRDGRVALSFGPPSLAGRRRDMEGQVTYLDGQPRVEATHLNDPATYILSDDGARVAVVDDGVISVQDLKGDRLLASARGLKDHVQMEMIFLGPNLVRIWQHEPGSLAIWDFDVTHKTLAKIGQINENVPFRGLAANADASRLLLPLSGKVVDGRTGALLYQLPPASRRGSAMLSDGSVVVVDRKGNRVQVFGPDGASRATIPLPWPISYGMLACEIEGGKAVLVLDRNQQSTMTLVIDVKRGVIERSDAVHAWAPGWYAADPRTVVLAADAPLAVNGPNGKLALWNTKTGEKKAL